MSSHSERPSTYRRASSSIPAFNAFRIRRSQYPTLRNDSCDVFGRCHIKRRVPDAGIMRCQLLTRMVRHLDRGPLLDRNVVARLGLNINGRPGGRDVKRKSHVPSPAPQPHTSRSCWATSPLAAMRSAPTTTACSLPWRIRLAAMLSQITVVGILSCSSSHAVRRAPCRNGRVSSAYTWIT